MSELIRSLSVLADGQPVSGFSRVRLAGGERLGLLPFLFTLRLWNLSEDGYLSLSRCKVVTVKCGEAEMVSGQFSDSVRTVTRQGTVTTVCFSPGLPLWQSDVSLSIDAGVTVRETVEQILSTSGTGVRLITSDGMPETFSRPQAFYGRTAECVEEALSASGARACLVPSGLEVVPSSGVSVSLTMDDTDLLDAPEFPHKGFMLLRTRPAGWTLGKCVRVAWEGEEYTGLIRERSFDLDTGDGPWNTELILEVSA